jgi:hypothetical protein
MSRFSVALLLLSCVIADGARFRSVRTTVSDRGGTVHINMLPVDGRNSVLHLRMVGGRISRRAAKRSIQATTKAIHACDACTVVVDMGACRGVSPLALPVTARFLLSHPELKQILIIEAKGAVRLACLTVRRLSGHDKLDLFRSFAAFESACTNGRNAARRRSALQVARSLRVQARRFARVRSLFDAAPKLPALPWSSDGWSWPGPRWGR